MAVSFGQTALGRVDAMAAFAETEPAEAALAGIAGLAWAGGVAMVRVATDALLCLAEAGDGFHVVTVTFTMPVAGAHKPATGTSPPA